LNIEQATYKGYSVYAGKKSDEGLIGPMVDHLIDTVELVKELHVRPIAFHLLLTEPDWKKLEQLPAMLKRFAKQYCLSGHSEEVFFLIAHEVRPRTKQEHSHLYVFCDSFTAFAREALKRVLIKYGYATEVKLQYRKAQYVPEHANPCYHSVRIEAADLILRASYITKYATKTKTKRRRWSGSVLPTANAA